MLFHKRFSTLPRILLSPKSVWATEPHAELPIKMGTSGAAAKPPTTVFKVFQRAVENHGDTPALKFKDTSQVCLTSTAAGTSTPASVSRGW